MRWRKKNNNNNILYTLWNEMKWIIQIQKEIVSQRSQFFFMRIIKCNATIYPQAEKKTKNKNFVTKMSLSSSIYWINMAYQHRPCSSWILCDQGEKEIEKKWIKKINLYQSNVVEKNTLKKNLQSSSIIGLGPRVCVCVREHVIFYCKLIIYKQNCIFNIIESVVFFYFYFWIGNLK